MMAITANTIKPNVDVSVLSVPELSGINFFSASSPAIATGPIIGRNLPNSNTIPVDIFQNTVLSPNPSKPLPLLAAEEVYSYSISLKPWKPGLANVADVYCGNAAAKAVQTKIRKGCAKAIIIAIFISLASIFLPINSGVLPTINPLMNTARMMKM